MVRQGLNLAYPRPKSGARPRTLTSALSTRSMPHRTTTSKAMIRRLAAAVGMAALVCGAPPTAAVGSSCGGAHALPGDASPEVLQQATLCLINAERSRHGLSRLRLDNRVTAAAHRYAGEMVRKSFMSHFSGGGGPAQRISRAGYRCHRRDCPRGENIAWSPRGASPERMVSLWMHSAGHRRNILYRTYAVIGLGIAAGHGSGAGMYVADFAGA